MSAFKAASIEVAGPYENGTVVEAAKSIRERLGGAAGIAFAFLSANYTPHIEEFCETLRVDGHIVDVVGCTAGGRIEGAQEFEGTSGFSILAIHGHTGEPVALDESGTLPINSPWKSKKPNAWIAMANPFSFPIEDWLEHWNASFPGIHTVGGLASGGGQEDTMVFINGKSVDAVAVPICGNMGLLPVLSQGCRPIGEPLTVTRADHNVIYALGGQDAYRVLETAFESLTDSEKSHARGNLFAGLAGSEYLEDFQSGDFLIKNILGADPNSGAVVIAGIPRVGQTLQYQILDREVALADLERAFEAIRDKRDRAFGSLLFSCLGRGEKFFGTKHRDASSLLEAVGNKPCA